MTKHDSRITELRIELKAAGYSPIPLVGKVPSSAGWPTMADSEAAIRMWPTMYPRATNTGINTRHTPAIDVDITDVGVCRKIYSIAREFYSDGMFLARVGRFPKFAILLRSEALKKIKVTFNAPDGDYHHIEILGDGQQLAAFGIHPDTNQPYRWDDGVEPGIAVPWGSLPLTDDGTNRRFLRAVTDELKRKHGWRLKQSSGGSCRRTPQQWHALVREGVDAGARNVTLASLTGHLLRHEVDPRVVLDLMLTWNRGKCRPPMSDEEVTAVVDSICGKELERRGQK